MQVVQLSMMLEALLVEDSLDPTVLECFFIEALCCSLGGTLVEAGKIKFDGFIKKISCMTTSHDENALANPGEIPGEPRPTNRPVHLCLC